MFEVITDLNGALRRVARASFYEDLEITPLKGEEDRFRVEDTTANEQVDDWEWSYEGGLRGMDTVSECTRLMDTYECFSTSEQIRYYMPDSVEALKNGKTVIFAYAVVTDRDAEWIEEKQEFYDADGYPADSTAGWILTANHYETDTEQD